MIQLVQVIRELDNTIALTGLGLVLVIVAHALWTGSKK